MTTEAPSNSSPETTPQKPESISDTTVLYVARGILLTSLTAASVTSSWALWKGRGKEVAQRFALASAYNGAVASATFFTIKYFLVSPTSALLRAPIEGTAPTPGQPLSWTAVRMREVPETALSGALAGGLYGSMRYTIARGGPRGMLIGAAFCSALQLAANELEVQRIKYVSKLGESRRAEQAAQSPSPLKPREPFSKTLMRWFGVRQVTREEYLEKLRAERDLVWKEIQQLEQEKEKVEREKDQA